MYASFKVTFIKRSSIFAWNVLIFDSLTHRNLFFRNGIAGSALCSFNMTSVNKTFDGAFKYQSSPSAAWMPLYDNLDHYKCQYGDVGSDPSLLSKASVNANKYQLMDTDVHPVHPDPVYTIDHERYASV